MGILRRLEDFCPALPRSVMVKIGVVDAHHH